MWRDYLGREAAVHAGHANVHATAGFAGGLIVQALRF
jgi:hypothetical protein